ncbi:acetyltransferase [Mucisphaera sp.]|uniref:acetyltransferase n=1 Tax=Mucisphaera sp. TaxID=2913024 RepID=UPI003D0965BD
MVAETAQLRWPETDIAYYDQNLSGTAIDGRRIQPCDEIDPDVPIALGIGDNQARTRIRNYVISKGFDLLLVSHPNCLISPSAEFGPGCFFGPNAIVHTHARLGAAVVINSGAIVEHECTLADTVHIAPGAVLAGSVTVGEQTLIGVGARVLPGITIGSHATIAAGAVVTEDIPDHATAIGVPAQIRQPADE